MEIFRKARELLVGDLRRYLVGPIGPEDEAISEPAWDRYHTGILFPSGVVVPAEEDDLDQSSDAASPDGGPDDGVLALANVARQAAAGITFQVDLGSAVVADLEYADYVPETIVPVDGAATPNTRRARSRIQWRRRPQLFTDVQVPVPGCGQSGATSGRPIVQHDDIELICATRTTGGVCTVTLSLVNRRPIPDREKGKRRTQDDLHDPAIYQASLKVRGASGSAVFISRPSGIHISDPEFLNHELLYRDVKQFAVGHGCSVDWTLQEGNPAKATSVELAWIPATEVAKASAVVSSLAESRCTELTFLASESRERVCATLDGLVDVYGKWIDALESRRGKVVDELAEGMRERIDAAARGNIRGCVTVKQRIAEGVALLRSDTSAFAAFQLANRAMADTMRKARPGNEPAWFPFQIAFLLMAMPSTLNPGHSDRDVMDLIWFPTGGGKTEAYLGLVSIVLFHRRLITKGAAVGSGTAVLTRYTLRLLTIQQFERAARTVMACELIRRNDPAKFGTTPFSIGLFVGNSATPGSIEQARKIVEGRAEEGETATTLPLSKCPWCGTSIFLRSQKVGADAVITTCPSKTCEFSAGIPFSCTDEEMFLRPPSIVIGTVDKFAMMAWEPRIRAFFGGLEKSQLPPTLIIQDELHLITDALGTVTALYETAIDHLCTVAGGAPKIVGSTATIRRAGDQARRLYDRRVQQFPPSGLDYNDSFFYSEDTGCPGRLYVGIHAQGRSPKYSLARVIGILSQGATKIDDFAARDHFYTLVAYFNSLRELGGAIVLAYDDVKRYIEAMPDAGPNRRKLSVIQELTSHLPSQQIPEVLAQLASGLLSRNENSAPIDLVLSTNMISVGVDVDRLGVMVVNGQPKTTSEYIQASSRVGRPRASAGLVVTLYNWTRPRDRSHYERFRSYHRSFYRYVEATTVTPFSPRARDRALHGVLFALARSSIPELSGSATALTAETERHVRELCKVISSRARRVDGADAEEATGEQLRELLRQWTAESLETATWRKEERRPGPYFLRNATSAAGSAAFDPTPMSMRDVDPPSPVKLMSSGDLAEAFPKEDAQ